MLTEIKTRFVAYSKDGHKFRSVDVWLTDTSAHLNDINSLTANYEITRTLRSLLESQCEKNQS